MAILKRNRTVKPEQLAGCLTEKNPENGAHGSEDFPRINVFEERDGWVFTFEVPGVDPRDLELTMRSSLMTVRGKRSSFFEGDESLIHKRESCIGECGFSRTVLLPGDADRDSVAAHVKNGMLFVTADKTDEPAERKIEIDHD
jgi:HSP20 family protein